MSGAFPIYKKRYERDTPAWVEMVKKKMEKMKKIIKMLTWL